MTTETSEVAQELQVSDAADQSVSATGGAEVPTAEQMRFYEQVRSYAEVEASKVQGAKDREIAERDKLIKLHQWEAQKHLSVQERLKELEAAEEHKLEKAGQGDRDVYDAMTLRKQNVQKAMALAELEQKLNWESLELNDLREIKQQQERLEQVKAIGDEFQLTTEQVAKLAEGGGTPEQTRYWAQEYASFNKVTKPPTPAPAKGTPGGVTDNVSALSPDEKIRWALEHPEKEKYKKGKE